MKKATGVFVAFCTMAVSAVAGQPPAQHGGFWGPPEKVTTGSRCTATGDSVAVLGNQLTLGTYQCHGSVRTPTAFVTRLTRYTPPKGSAPSASQAAVTAITADLLVTYIVDAGPKLTRVTSIAGNIAVGNVDSRVPGVVFLGPGQTTTVEPGKPPSKPVRKPPSETQTNPK